MVIKTERLIKSFNSSRAVSAVNLNIEAGTVYGLLGRNGAGKTTLLRLILGILKADQGSAKVFGEDFATSDKNLRQRVAYIGQDYRFYNSYTLAELVNILAPLYPKWNWDKADHLLNLFELKLDQRLGELSGGQRQKASMLVAFSCGAELLILDEPAAALDPISRRLAMGEMMNFIMDNPEKNTIIFSTHIVDDLERVANRVGMMDNGQLTHEFDLDDIHDSMRKVQIVFHQDIEANYQLEAALSCNQDKNVLTAIYDFSEESSKVELDKLKKSGASIQDFPVNLEEFFVQIYGSSSVMTVE